ncbi:zinc-ribbon domain-containing protein [Roseimaritima sediminicola]|uniref:zinc-ribbon domain-containing protein n=1 Tax=Roseimaritima sediminicola TaxID=2662066 RepID=UPI0012983FFE|nr:zinc-ribbon domain-containing protein [Roseimaritima sediminicola]
MNLHRTVQRGDFICPQCRGLESYRLRARRPFLTVYLIPLAPLGNRELFVQCQGCKQRFDERILERPKRDVDRGLEAELFAEEALRAAALMVIAKGHFTEEDISTLQRAGEDLFGRPVSREPLGELCSSAFWNRIPAINYVQSVAHRWSQPQRQAAMKACFLAASTGGDLPPDQIQRLESIRQDLNLTDEEFEQAIESAVELE